MAFDAMAFMERFVRIDDPEQQAALEVVKQHIADKGNRSTADVILDVLAGAQDLRDRSFDHQKKVTQASEVGFEVRQPDDTISHKPLSADQRKLWEKHDALEKRSFANLVRFQESLTDANEERNKNLFKRR